MGIRDRLDWLLRIRGEEREVRFVERGREGVNGCVV